MAIFLIHFGSFFCCCWFSALYYYSKSYEKTVTFTSNNGISMIFFWNHSFYSETFFYQIFRQTQPNQSRLQITVNKKVSKCNKTITPFLFLFATSLNLIWKTTLGACTFKLSITYFSIEILTLSSTFFSI